MATTSVTQVTTLKSLRYFDEKGCCVVITTRTSERDEQVAHADTCAEITGLNAEYRTVFKTRILGCKTDAQENREKRSVPLR